MSDPVVFEVPGEPQGKRRARFVRAGHCVKAYADPKSVDYETFIREMFCVAHPAFVPLEGALAVEIHAYCGMPGGVGEKKRMLMESGELRPTRVPDPDNIAKSVLDALTGLVFKNDSQVTRLVVEKAYSERPRVEVEVKRND